MARILCVGIATLDIINTVDTYPAEDTEVRASNQSRQMGGNAANTAVVLAQLGNNRVSWAGNLAQPAEAVDATFARHGVDTSAAVHIPGAVLPTSCILLSGATGSRSIVHFRDMPEYSAADFLKLDLRKFDWVHFEGRAIDQLATMLRHARVIDGLSISLEIEKPRTGIEDLLGAADVLMFSRDYARSRGFPDATTLLDSLPGGVVATCTWGAEGAWAADPEGSIRRAPAIALQSVVDTLGAGDVFNAGMIHAMSGGRPVADALRDAVALASAQCAREGLVLSA